MSVLELLQLNLLSPVILCFFLGIAATLVKSDMRFPEQLYHGLSIYLLLAIGIKGGVAMVEYPGSKVWMALGLAAVISALTPLWTNPVLRFLGKLSPVNSWAVAAHYGSVSVVTFLAGIAFLQALGETYEGFLPAMVAVMEVPSIIIALLMANRTNGDERTSWARSLKTVVTGKSVFLLLGGLVVGMLSGQQGLAQVDAFFVAPFKGVLCLFLLEMGMVASRRFEDLRKAGIFLIAFGILMPVLHAFLGMYLGQLIGLSRGGAFILGVLAASSSYIAAPATIRLALPQASPALYLTSSLAITFPFNLVAGIPLYYLASSWFY